MLVLLIVGVFFAFAAEDFRKERMRYNPIMGKAKDFRDIKTKIYEKGINCNRDLKKQICQSCTNTGCHKRYETDRAIAISVYLTIATLHSLVTAGMLMAIHDFVSNDITSIVISILGIVSIMLLAYLFVCRMFQIEKFKEWTKKTTVATIIFIIATIVYIMLGL